MGWVINIGKGKGKGRGRGRGRGRGGREKDNGLGYKHRFLLPNVDNPPVFDTVTY